MQYFPVFLDLREKHCLVVGAGSVGRRKIRALLERDPAGVLVIDTSPPGDEFKKVLRNPLMTYEVREFQEQDLDDKWLVIASTDNEELNWRISNLCKERSILCNIVDQPEKCSFIVPAVFRQGDLTLAVSTGGSSPALAKRIRQGLDEYFGSHYGGFLALMSRLRPLVLELGHSTENNSALFRELVNSDLLEAFEARDREKSVEIMERMLPSELHPAIPELLDECL
jgi:precorrin-2 dehydrogenase/sirohydrochlorin ferrochelatase